MFVYALGRPIEPSDQPTINGIVAKAKSEDYTFRALVKAIVATEAFQSK